MVAMGFGGGSYFFLSELLVMALKELFGAVGGWCWFWVICGLVGGEVS